MVAFHHDIAPASPRLFQRSNSFSNPGKSGSEARGQSARIVFNYLRICGHQRLNYGL